jgi:hypothetical protein
MQGSLNIEPIRSTDKHIKRHINNSKPLRKDRRRERSVKRQIKEKYILGE